MNTSSKSSIFVHRFTQKGVCQFCALAFDEFVIIFQIEALSAEGDPSEEQQQVLNGLKDRINGAIELYGEDGAMVRIGGRSATTTYTVDVAHRNYELVGGFFQSHDFDFF